MKKNFRGNELGEGCVSRKKLAMSSIRSQKSLLIPLQTTANHYTITVYRRRFVIVPPEKKEAIVQISDDMIERSLVLINSKKIKTIQSLPHLNATKTYLAPNIGLDRLHGYTH